MDHPYFYALTVPPVILKNTVIMVVVATICPNRDCSALVLVSREDAKIKFAGGRTKLELDCAFCRSRFRVLQSDLVVRRVAPVWLLIRFDHGDPIAGLYLNGKYSDISANGFGR